MRTPMEVGARAGRRGALLRSCPPASPCGRPLLLYFAAQSAPPARSGHAAAVLDDGTPPPSPDNVLGCRATREGMTASGSKPTFAQARFMRRGWREAQ